MAWHKDEEGIENKKEKRKCWRHTTLPQATGEQKPAWTDSTLN
jgi:hypothetical protein